MFNHVIAYVSATLHTLEKRRDEDGITAIEYALMAAGIAAIIVAAMVTLDTKITALFAKITV
ncbi:MAG: Flp family type IVb pilin [Actinomycetota bacterium]|nr:Flp family type IVb pilin [Actinomycetota bacterium]